MTSANEHSEEIYLDNGEQGHEGCFFQAGTLPTIDVSATLIVHRCDGMNFIVRLPSRQMAVDLMATLIVPDFTAAPNAFIALQIQPKPVFLGASPGLQFILEMGHSLPAKPKGVKHIILVKPTQLQDLLERTEDTIAFEPSDEPNVSRLY